MRRVVLAHYGFDLVGEDQAVSPLLKGNCRRAAQRCLATRWIVEKFDKSAGELKHAEVVVPGRVEQRVERLVLPASARSRDGALGGGEDRGIPAALIARIRKGCWVADGRNVAVAGLRSHFTMPHCKGCVPANDRPQSSAATGQRAGRRG